MTNEDLHWLAGLLEGEGCFGTQTNRRAKNGLGKVNATIQLNMNDEDVVRRAFDIVGVGSVGGPYGKHRGGNINAQGYYKLSIRGQEAADLAKQLLDSGLMGARRSGRIIQILEANGTYSP